MKIEEIFSLMKKNAAFPETSLFVQTRSSPDTSSMKAQLQLSSIRCEKVLQFPVACRKIAYEIVKHYWDMDIQVVVSCSLPAILLATEVARQLEARIIFTTNQSSESEAELHKQFELHAGDRVLLIDNIVTPTPDYLKPLLKKILTIDARLIGVGCIIDASKSHNPFNVRQITVFTLEDLQRLDKQKTS